MNLRPIGQHLSAVMKTTYLQRSSACLTEAKPYKDGREVEKKSQKYILKEIGEGGYDIILISVKARGRGDLQNTKFPVIQYKHDPQ